MPLKSALILALLTCLTASTTYSVISNIGFDPLLELYTLVSGLIFYMIMLLVLSSQAA